MNDECLPCGLTACPEIRYGDPVYCQARDGLWYPVRSTINGRLLLYGVSVIQISQIAHGMTFPTRLTDTADTPVIVDAKE